MRNLFLLALPILGLSSNVYAEEYCEKEITKTIEYFIPQFKVLESLEMVERDIALAEASKLSGDHRDNTMSIIYSNTTFNFIAKIQVQAKDEPSKTMKLLVLRKGDCSPRRMVQIP